MIQKIAILGVGVMGASLAAAWKQYREENNSSYPILVGYDKPETIQVAKNLHLLDELSTTLQNAVQDADLVVLATPIKVNNTLLCKILPYLKSNALITDIGSVKLPIMNHANAHLATTHLFIGGHPMTGSEKSGPAYADSFLFENATYVLTPPNPQATKDPRFLAFTRLLQQTGARILVMDAERHDRIAATISHLPQLLAVTMMNFAATQNQLDDAFLKLAAGGFRDMTRIASSSFSMWKEILETNETAISRALQQFIKSLEETSNNIQKKNLHQLGHQFHEASEARSSIPKNTKGFLKPLSDVYVFAKDKPGFLFKLTKLFYDADLNIKDIELLKIREGTGAAFRIGFETEHDANNALNLLITANYKAQRLQS